MIKFFKSLLGNNQSEKSRTNQGQVKSCINSENDRKNTDSYNIILNYDELITEFLELKKVPQYAIDWLADSIKRDVVIERTAIFYSVDKGMPYLCETEDETWIFEKEENPLQDSTEGIYSALLCYKYGSTANTNKLNYWINRLISLANNGNIIAQVWFKKRTKMVMWALKITLNHS